MEGFFNHFDLLEFTNLDPSEFPGGGVAGSSAIPRPFLRPVNHSRKFPTPFQRLPDISACPCSDAEDKTQCENGSKDIAPGSAIGAAASCRETKTRTDGRTSASPISASRR